MSQYDVVVVGSGFGGSVTALRLAEKGYRVLVLEAGRRFADDEFARTSWDLRRFLWAPRLGCFGIQRIHRLPDVTILAGAGVGGGSLVYANTLYRPDEAFYDDPQWRDITDWRAELAPAYDLASRMLGVTQNPTMTASDVAMRTVADQMGVGHTFALTPVGVFFGDDAGRTVPDPYFGGAGPDRTGCIQCGECMTGCRHGAKNTLVKNYLYLAEQLGVEVRPLTTVCGLREVPGGWQVETERTGAWFPRRTRDTVTASQVVLAAGTWGTQRLLHRMRDWGRLPHLSPRLGELTRTNSESLVGALSRRRDVDFTRGVAITSSFRPEPDTHVEPVRYGRGSNAMGLLSVSLTDGDGPWPRGLHLAGRPAAPPDHVPELALGPAVVGADDHRARHAVAGQLAGRVGPPAVRPVDADQPAGTRHAEPDLDPGRQRSRPPARAGHRRRPGRERGRPARLDDDRALPRRRLDRGRRDQRCARRLAPGVRP